MTRVVLDTNVAVSALLNPRGLEALVLDLVFHGLLALCLTEPILAEYRAVLSRPKFRRLDRRTVTRTLADLRAVATLVQPTRAVTASPDAEDNRFLECAEAASADFLVTGNRRHFPERWLATEVVSARTLLDRLGPTLLPPQT